MFYLLSPKLWIAVAAIVAAIVSNTVAYRAGKATVRAQWNEEKVTQLEAARQQEAAFRAREQQLIAAKQESETKYVELKKRFERSAAGAQSELGKLRDELASRGNQPAAQGAASCAGADGRAGLERELLGHCAAALVGVAQEADRLEAIVVGLQGYVRGVCLKQ